MELELNEQKNQEIENSNNIQNNLEKNKQVELLVEQEVTVENQNIPIILSFQEQDTT